MDGLVIPGVTEDDAIVPDMLNIDNDALAVAAVIASRQVIPPLTIALYGPWGSGKSFFMKRIEHHVRDFADSGDLAFEPNVEHIVFKAWHYERGHLMASLHRQIFEALRVKQPGADAMIAEADDRIKRRQDRVGSALDELVSARKHESERESDVDSYIALQSDPSEILRRTALSDLEGAVSDDVIDSFKSALKEANLPALEQGGMDLMGSVEQLIDTSFRVRFLLASGSSWYKSPLFAGVVVSMLCVLAVGILRWQAPAIISDIGSSVAELASVLTGIAAAVSQLTDKIKKIKEPAERIRKATEERANQAQEQQEKEIEELKKKRDEARQLVVAASDNLATEKQELEKEKEKREELEPSAILEQYIADRAATTEYDEHLGVVARLHRDLHGLSAALNDAIADDRTRINRIVLYIDDLDRCSPDTVFAVLEALHLFLSLPHFVIVVGVDPRSLGAAVRKLRPELFRPFDRAFLPDEYVEKIFQVSYTLPCITADGGRRILRDIALRSMVAEAIETESSEDGRVFAEASDSDEFLGISNESINESYSKPHVIEKKNSPRAASYVSR